MVVRPVTRETEKNMLPVIEYYLGRIGIALRDDEGQGLIEYVLIAALISVVAIVTIRLVGTNVGLKWTAVSDALT
jgi:pilus assembly protein Flp/PilA